MKRFVFKLKIYEGREAEFKKRYKEVWPELVYTAERYGIKSFALYMEEGINEITCFLECHEQWNKEAFLNEESVLLWRLIMNSLLDTDNNHQPIGVALNEVFYFKDQS